MRSPLWRMRISLLALGLTWVGLLPSGWSLCVGSDGHFAVELILTTAGPCCGEPAGDPAADADASPDCEDCRDLQLSAGSVVGVRTEASSHAPAVLVLPASLADPVPHPSARYGCAAERTARRPLASPLETVLIRC